ncbi:hypothetical protein EDD86DRAFT_201762 [Gorgonomyces haynaldii]|nr:hypothetical protein EDD86DRAFT_201762 [Gorgonomyces haynaldii]
MSENIIPASRRPDGTLRKEIKVRPGYVDPLVKYSNSRLDRAKEPVGIPGLTPKEPKKKKINMDSMKQALESVEQPSQKKQPATEKTQPAVKQQVEQPVEDSPEKKREKRLKALNKKLRQIEQLEEKQAKGEELDKDQLLKLSQKSDVLQEISNL